MATASFGHAANSTTDVSIKDLTVCVKNKVLITESDLCLAYGHRYALVGENGSGKTTLLNLIATGAIPLPGNTNAYLVAQELYRSDVCTCMDYVLDADQQASMLQEEADALEMKMAEDLEYDNMESVISRYNEIQEQLRSSHDAVARVSKILTGLGFSEDKKKSPTTTLSGGWLMRLSIARALYMQPRFMLLDEPTNHLDVKAVIWLEEYLRRWKHTLVVVTHDRHFIDEVATDILYLHNKQLRHFRGDYGLMLSTLQQQTTAAAKKKSTQERKDEVSFSFGESAFGIPATAELQVRNVSFGYDVNVPKRQVWNADICITPKSRIAVIGANGSGKTTLLRLMVGDIQPTSGEVVVHRKLRVGYYGQHNVDSMDMDVTSIDILRSENDVDKTLIHKYLSMFGLKKVDRIKPLKELSGGQRARVIFTKLYLQQPHILVLDEPSNHLDMESTGALADAILAFKGGIVLSSHNSQLLSIVTDKAEHSEVWVMDDGIITRYEQTFDQYRQDIIDAHFGSM